MKFDERYMASSNIDKSKKHYVLPGALGSKRVQVPPYANMPYLTDEELLECCHWSTKQHITKFVNQDATFGVQQDNHMINSNYNLDLEESDFANGLLPQGTMRNGAK